MDALHANARDLEREMDWLARLLDARFKRYFGAEDAPHSLGEIAPPELGASASPYANFVRHCALRFDERAVLALTLATLVQPQLLDVFFVKNAQFDRRFTEFGGEAGEGNFVPTVETALFLLSEDFAGRFGLLDLFGAGHFFTQDRVLRLHDHPDGGVLKAALQLGDEYAVLFTTGRVHQPAFGANFPARVLDTGLAWSDLVLNPATRAQVEEIDAWIRHGDTLMAQWGMAAKLRPGYRSLFHGPPGTGKTMTASLLGKATDRPVYKIDLSLVVSKYIGETEKNLARVFDEAESRGWILFFDEADALFGKRSETRNAHDRYANQETAFLLQRLEVFDGIAILATNLRDNLDEAFTRRFESVIYFPMPRPEERLRIWRQGFPAASRLEAGVDLERLAHGHELSGSAIMNVIRYAALQALRCASDTITLEALQQGIRKEYVKERKGG